MIIRIWGRTVLNQKQNDPISITEELRTAFSTRPCFGIDIRGSTSVMRVRDGLEVREEPVRRLVSKQCILWSEDGYAADGSSVQEVEGALCKVCKVVASEPIMDPKAEFMEEKETRTKDHICGICGKGFYRENHLKSHTVQKHGGGYMPNPKKSKGGMNPFSSAARMTDAAHECSECGMGFETVLELTDHEESGQCEGEDTYRQVCLCLFVYFFRLICLLLTSYHYLPAGRPHEGQVRDPGRRRRRGRR